MEGNLCFKIVWASLIVGRKFTVFALFYFVFEGNFKYKPPGAYIWRGDLTEGFLRYEFGGAYICRSVYMEGLIFGILRYFTVLYSMGSIVQHEKEFWILFGFLSEERNLCSPIQGKREFYYLKGRVAACYGTLMWSSSTGLLSLTSLKPL